MISFIQEARGSGIPQGQFLDDIAAEKFIADRLGQLKNGAKTFDAPPGLGRIIHPNGTFTDAKHIRIVPSKSGVSSAFPIYQRE
ncbi:hypothetical protein [Marinicella litoralis]|uniref:hypothetical protein n=1 Tax=Marinicella litoralis TaxID=644220 RepID=UPI000BFEFF65|nr:hypothetical protein [Marinicella litoralis]